MIDNKILNHAENYCQLAGFNFNLPPRVDSVLVPFAQGVALAYENMKHEPKAHDVARDYKQFTDETKNQYLEMIRAGINVDFLPPGLSYFNADAMIKDIRENKHLWIFPTVSTFGNDSNFDASDNPLLAGTGFEISGRQALVNDLARATHDFFGHAMLGNDFSPAGEETAYRIQRAMYKFNAKKALASETRGQSSFVYYGPDGAHNRTCKPHEVIYANQKTGTLPAWAMEDY